MWRQEEAEEERDVGPNGAPGRERTEQRCELQMSEAL